MEPAPFSGFGEGKLALDKALESVLPDMLAWTVHDLRRTARTLMSRAGVLADHAERVLGHVGLASRARTIGTGTRRKKARHWRNWRRWSRRSCNGPQTAQDARPGRWPIRLAQMVGQLAVMKRRLKGGLHQPVIGR